MKNLASLIVVAAIIAMSGVNAAEKTNSPFPDTDKRSTEQELKKPMMEAGKLELVPSFCSCGYYFGTEELDNVKVFFRKSGSVAWREMLEPRYFPRQKVYRGSIPYLDEDSDYEFELRDGDKVVTAGKFKTWSSQVKIAKTIVLNAKNFKQKLKITDQGTPDGWIRYTAEPGFVLETNREVTPLRLVGAKYVILENLVIRGGGHEVIALDDCEGVRILNCDIAGWGRESKQDFTHYGQFKTLGRKKKTVNMDAAIAIHGGSKIVVERCYIHDAAGYTNSWRYAHPAGTEAIAAYSPRETVIRYNDFVGTDEHRFNDAIEGPGNFIWDGGLNRDVDVYGNFLIFCNDDCIELDGGMCNARFFLNRFEAALCGVSFQGAMTTPCYIFNNLGYSMGDHFGVGATHLKTGGGGFGHCAAVHIFNNTFIGQGEAGGGQPQLIQAYLNNVFDGNMAFNHVKLNPKSVEDYNLINVNPQQRGAHSVSGDPQFVDRERGVLTPKSSSPLIGKGKVIPGFTPEVADIGAVQKNDEKTQNLPYRPFPVALDAAVLNFKVKSGRVTPKAQIVTATVGGKNLKMPFTVRKNDGFPWLNIYPTSGVLESGKKFTFRVTIDPKKATWRKVYRGAFMIRLENGLSRPVSVYAETDWRPPYKPNTGKSFAYYLNLSSPVEKNPYKIVKPKFTGEDKVLCLDPSVSLKPITYKFKVPKDGDYYVMVRGVAPKERIRGILLSVDDIAPLRKDYTNDDSNFVRTDLYGFIEVPSWIPVEPGANPSQTRIRSFKLRAGEHILKIAPRDYPTPVHIYGIAIVEDPLPFEPR